MFEEVFKPYLCLAGIGLGIKLITGWEVIPVILYLPLIISVVLWLFTTAIDFIDW